mmetsp:Transcript_12344/g.25208  ORF Transcript_12344/g.25208 Transcript_12344/m.25208 type:complete len:296 (+) Transcript_12344:121-1008(+)
MRSRMEGDVPARGQGGPLYGVEEELPAVLRAHGRRARACHEEPPAVTDELQGVPVQRKVFPTSSVQALHRWGELGRVKNHHVELLPVFDRLLHVILYSRHDEFTLPRHSVELCVVPRSLDCVAGAIYAHTLLSAAVHSGVQREGAHVAAQIQHPLARGDLRDELAVRPLVGVKTRLLRPHRLDAVLDVVFLDDHGPRGALVVIAVVLPVVAVLLKPRFGRLPHHVVRPEYVLDGARYRSPVYLNVRSAAHAHCEVVRVQVHAQTGKAVALAVHKPERVRTGRRQVDGPPRRHAAG